MATESCASGKRRRIHSPGVNFISKLGDDLLLEILIRLPNPRSACRCKSVCKLWGSLISDPGFNRRFVSHHQSINELHPPLLISSEDQQSIVPSFLPLPRTANHELRFAVLDSFKELLLCGFQNPESLDEEFGRSYFVCNPFTKQWIALHLAPNRPTGSSGLVARLVCEPRNSYNLDLGDDHQAAAASVVYSEYRFRVVCVYLHTTAPRYSTRLDVFCSESGKWRKDTLVLYRHFLCEEKNVVSCNGELFWAYDGYDRSHSTIAVYNPFRPDVPPACIDVPELFLRPWWDISISRGALHVSVFEENPASDCSRIASSVWRLEEDRKSFSIVCEGVFKKPRFDPGVQLDDMYREILSGTNGSLERISCPYMHPEKPEIVFFHYLDVKGAILSCDLRRGDLEFHSELAVLSPRWALFQARGSCWPIPIPRYEELRAVYNGRYDCWVQSSKPTTPAVTGPPTPAIAEERQSVNGSGHGRKDTDHHHMAGILSRAMGLQYTRK